MIRTANPALNEKVFSQFGDFVKERSDAMTLGGTVTKTGFLLALVTLSAAGTWRMVMPGPSQDVARAFPWMLGGAITAAVAGLIYVFFARKLGFIFAPLYAAGQGFFLGGLSAFFESKYPGIAAQAVVLTFGTMAGLLFIYATRLIRPSENFKLGLAAATVGIGLFYLVAWILSLFSVTTLTTGVIWSNGAIGIGFSVLVVVIAALNLVLDFDFIESGVNNGAPKYMEWYGAFGLMVTLIWLYVEILRLLAKLNSRR